MLLPLPRELIALYKALLKLFLLYSDDSYIIYFDSRSELEVLKSLTTNNTILFVQRFLRVHKNLNIGILPYARIPGNEDDDWE